MAYEFRGVKAVLFDLDDTLYDYPPANEAGNAAVLHHLALHTGCSKDDVRTAFARGREEIHVTFRGTAEMHSRLRYIERTLALLGFRAGAELLAREANDLFWIRFIMTMHLREGARECIVALRENSVRIGIVTDFFADIQKRKIAALRLAELIDVLASSERAGREKPDPAPYRLALSELGVVPEEAMMVGEDYDKDVMGARAVGIAPIYYRNGRNPDPPEPTPEVWSFSDLQTMLLGA